jgi:hypothetical protein
MKSRRDLARNLCEVAKLIPAGDVPRVELFMRAIRVRRIPAVNERGQPAWLKSLRRRICGAAPGPFH